MAKIRVHELAKELEIPSKEMVDILQKLGINVKNHMSTMEDTQSNWVKKKLSEESPVKHDEKNQQNNSSKHQQTVVPTEQPKSGFQKTPPQRIPASGGQGNDKNRGPRNNQVHGTVEQKSHTKDVTRESVNRSRAANNKEIRTNRDSHIKPMQKAAPQQHRENTNSVDQQKRQQTAGKDSLNRNNHRKPGQTSAAQQNRQNTRPIEQKNRPQTADSGNRSRAANDNGSRVNRDKQAKTGQRTTQQPNRQNAKPGQSAAGSRGQMPQFKKDYRRPQKKSKHKRKKVDVELSMPEVINIDNSITVRDFAEKLHKSSAEIVKKLMELGTMASINESIDFETAEILASLFEVRVEHSVSEEDKILEEIVDDEENLKLRPPVVTVMGHVDHGKTSLLDKIRKADVVSGEAGGITQHIGAYQVNVNNNKITFIDTPGHEAFTAMRARGANLTDIVILVVAADDGVMPQTIEAINHIKAAEVPFIVAINKIDRTEANPDRVMQQLTKHQIVPEEWGGDTIFVPVSAKSGEGINTLLEMILLVAEVNEIKANPDRLAEGVVIEGQLDKGRGPVGTVLILKGSLGVGDTVICGNNLCRVRAMCDDRGRKVDKASPSMPVEITGWAEVPEAGGKVQACNEKVAKEIINLRMGEKKLQEQKQSSRVSLDDFFKHIQDNNLKELNLIIKGDVQGSIEALDQSLIRLSTEAVKVNVIHSAVGAISETDVMLASASNAIIVGFNVRPDNKARKHAEAENIEVLLYRVIYEAIDDVKKAMVGLLDPEYKEKFVGRASVRTTFKVPNVGIIAGSYVIDGKMQRNAEVRVLRDGVIVYEGKLSSLKRFKDDAREVLENYECGIGIKDFNDIKDGDIIEAFILEEVPREL